MKILTSFALITICLLTISCDNKFKKQNDIDMESSAQALPSHLKINQIQVLGTHNSYSKPIDTAVLNYLDPVVEGMMDKYFAQMSDDQKAFFDEYHPNKLKFSETLSYNHPNFDEQLNAGLRSLEIDVYYDPTGGRYTNPGAYEFLIKQGKKDLMPFDTTDLSKPGFKVMHIADVDFRTHYPTFSLALKAIKTWSDNNPKHIPIFIMIEAKDSGMPIFPNPTEVLPFDEEAFNALDNEILSILGKDNIITPDQVRGEYNTLEEAVQAQNWPLLTNSLGKFLFMLLPSTAGANMDTPYLKNRPSLEGRAMFLQSQPGKPYSAFLLLDNALIRKDEIMEHVKKGYLVRSRTDIDTYEAKVNDKTRSVAAFESGAQVLSTDYFKPGNAYGTDYFITLPGNNPARVNPINSNGSYNNKK